MNGKLREEKQRAELQLLKVTGELTAKTEEFRKAICEMKEQTDASSCSVRLLGINLKDKCNMCEIEKQKSERLAKDNSELQARLSESLILKNGGSNEQSIMKKLLEENAALKNRVKELTKGSFSNELPRFSGIVSDFKPKHEEPALVLLTLNY